MVVGLGVNLVISGDGNSGGKVWGSSSFAETTDVKTFSLDSQLHMAESWVWYEFKSRQAP